MALVDLQVRRPRAHVAVGPGLARHVDADVDQYPGELARDVVGAGFVEQQRSQQVTSGLLQGLRSRLPVLAWPGPAWWSGRAAGARPLAEAGTTQALDVWHGDSPADG
jgi:hypothetical protein